ncbi:MAG: alpha/beta fold hydrolase [Flavobacteriaceae bacterium]|nr:alpha/beta fold hydrolase [Flavobacteriaceae bacterium]
MFLNSKIYGAERKETSLLVFHGLFGMLDNWGSFGRIFGELMPCHLVDLRNHGKSFHSEEMSLQAMADDILFYLNHYQLDKVHLLGHSLGGKAIMQFAISYPERVEKLIVVDIAPKAYIPHHQEVISALESVDFSLVSSRKEVETKLSENIKSMPVVQFLMKNLYWEAEGKLNWRFNLKTLAEKYDDFVANPIKSGVFERETLFVAGEKSNYILPQDELLIRQQFPNYELVKISNAGHWVQVENPMEFNTCVKEFLNQ